MAAKSRYSLQRTMIIYFLLIGFASLLVTVEFVADFHGGALKQEIWENIRAFNLNRIGPEQIFSPIDRLRSKALLMVGIILFVMVIVLTMFIKNITEPLQHMIQLSQKISTGDLTGTIRIHAKNELAELGGVINEMASNLQEIILLSQRICHSGQRFAAGAIPRLQGGALSESESAALLKDVEGLKEDIDLLDEVIAYFRFYSVETRSDVG